MKCVIVFITILLSNLLLIYKLFNKNTMDCFTKEDGLCYIDDTIHCCHCYSETYQHDNLYYNLGESFLMFPGTHCSITSCAEAADGETGPYIYSQCCCSAVNDPICHDCSLIFCPLAFSLDLLCLIPRCFISKHGYGNKCCKCIIQKCHSQSQENTENNEK